MKITKALINEQINKMHGNLSAVSRSVGRSRNWMYQYIEKHPDLWDTINEARETMLDNAESVLYQKVLAGSTPELLFFLKTQGKRRGYVERQEITGSNSPDPQEAEPFRLPADAISESFYNVYRDIRGHNHTEYVFKGGRGSTKSSFASEMIIELITNNPEWHVLATRQVKDTLRDSVYSQLVWAINYLGLSERFKCTTSPLEITYIPTGQKIYFRGGDDPLKIKSIKPRFGYINVIWFEELDQFRGEAAVRSIVQSAIRGGDKAFIFKSFNPPRSRNNWVNKWLEIPRDDRYVHESDYRTVPVEWLGKTFIDEAEFLQEVNPSAYEHEYLGIPTSTGGLVFENVEARAITNEEIAEFDRVLHGLDWGYFPDPAHYARCHYDAARLTLYIFQEYRGYKHSNRQMYDALVERGLSPADTLICDSAEPKSIADFREYGASVRGAEKGPESVKYSMKWLQSLRKIVIDNQRAPYTAEEFLNYEHEMDRDGEYISDYPDKNNHGIDAVRYATNRIWKRRGS
jgi:phage terminase large subunit